METVLGDLLLNPDDIESMSCERALQQFKKLDVPEPEIGKEDGRQEMFEVVIKTPRRLNLCIDFVPCGASFRMASRLMDCTQAESGIGLYGGL